nr:unnamed protein product [Digitaria exilis]
MAPAMSGTLGASSVAALRPCAGRRAQPAASSVAPRGSGAVRCSRGVRWEAERGRGRLFRVRCDAAVAEKPTEEEATGEEFDDTGVGMTKDELKDCLGTIAQSGTSKFLKALKVEGEEETKEGEEATEGEKQKKKKTITEKYWDWELANETKPIWMRNPKEIEKTEYNEFYKKTFNEFLDPLAHTHFTTEGEVEFRSVLYVPGMAPLSNEEIMNPKTKNIRLYVKRVFISDDFDGELDYKKFWESFGKFIKLGCIEDTGNHKRLAPLLRFYSSKNEADAISLDQYVENMPESQKAIYYIATDSLQSAKTAPFLEKLVQKDIEVLYLVEPIDEVAIQNLQTYKEKKFVDISKEDLELGDEEEENKETKQEFTLLCDWVKQQLGDKVAKAACKNEPESTEAKRAVELLYEAALISSGYTPESPAELGGKIYEMMAIALGGRWGRSDTGEAEATGEASLVADSSEDTVTEVIEPSEVRPESDPWRD